MLTSDSSSTVDRRIAVKLLTTYLSRGQTSEDLELMARMLGFTGITKLLSAVSPVGLPYIKDTAEA